MMYNILHFDEIEEHFKKIQVTYYEYFQLPLVGNLCMRDDGIEDYAISSS